MTAPVFVRAMSRSGGTLMVTILDAHPDVAMSYELYPNLLLSDAATPEFVDVLADRIEATGDLVAFSRRVDDKSLRTFIARLPRGGLDARAVVALLRDQVASGMGFRTAAEALAFVERCASSKMSAEGKARWGLKCTARYADYAASWPDACFLYMVRDGRDVLASNLAKRPTAVDSPASMGRSWAKGIRGFRELVADPRVRALEVRYETLVADADREIRRICQFLEVDFDASMLDFHSKTLTIFGASHLSMDRITKPVDAASVGRWRKDLKRDQIDEFCGEAGDLLDELGYLEPAHAD
jgi:hypothetical protein